MAPCSPHYLPCPTAAVCGDEVSSSMMFLFLVPWYVVRHASSRYEVESNVGREDRERESNAGTRSEGSDSSGYSGQVHVVMTNLLLSLKKSTIYSQMSH